MTQQKSAFDRLSDRDQFIVLAYISNNCDMVRALRAIGAENEHTSELSIYQAAYRLRKRVDIIAAIDEVRSDRMMSALEVMDRHTEIARGDIAELLDDEGRLDLVKARAAGKTHLIKGIATREWFDKGKGALVTETRCEMYPADAAQRTIMKYHRLLVDVIDVKRLPKDKDELVALLADQIKRTTGREVGSAAPDGAKGAN